MAAVAVLLAFAFASCSDDDDDNGGGGGSSSGKKLVQWAWTEDDDDPFIWNLSYNNSSGKLNNITSEESYNLQYTWGTNSVVETVISKGSHAYTVTYTISNGLVTKAVCDDSYEDLQTINYSYDSSNRLTGTEYYDGSELDYTSKITWENNAPVKQEFTYNDRTVSRTFEYGSQTCDGYNPAIANYLWFLVIAFSDDDVKLSYTNPEMFGIETNKLPTKVVDGYAGGGTFNVAYTYDSDNYISSFITDYEDGDYGDKWTYTWE